MFCQSAHVSDLVRRHARLTNGRVPDAILAGMTIVLLEAVLTM